MKRRAALLLAAWPLAAAPAQPVAMDAQSIPGIDRMRVAIPDGSLGAHSVVVLEVASRHAPHEALTEVERHWRAQGADTVLRAHTGHWFVLSRRTGAVTDADANRPEGFETLQLRASVHGGSEGLLTRWEPARETSTRADASPRLVPDDARVVRQLASGSPAGRAARTLIASLERSLDDAESHLDRHLRRIGFEPLRAPDRAKDLRWRDDRARFYRSARAELLVTLHRQRHATQAVLYHVELPR